jgi:arylformamidase
MQTPTTRRKRTALLKSLNYRIHDLTRIISQEMPVYPDDPQPRFEPHSTIRSNKVNVTKIMFGSHTGTHIDAQWHFLPDGSSIDAEPLDKFIGDAIIVDMSGKPGEGITARDFERVDIKSNDIILVYTGTGNRRTDFTYFESDAAEWMVNHRIKCVGTDTLSIEKYGRIEAPVHKMLLSNSVRIIENLNSNLKQFAGRRMFLVCLPLPLEGIDGSPARAVLLEIIK